MAGGACMTGGVHLGGHTWQGSCMVAGVCILGGIHGRGHAWWRGCA